MQLKLVYSLIILLLFSAFTPTQQNPTVFMIGDSTMADSNTNKEITLSYSSDTMMKKMT